MSIARILIWISLGLSTCRLSYAQQETKLEEELEPATLTKDLIEPVAVIEETELTISVQKADDELSPVANAKIIVTYADGQEFERQTSQLGVAVLKGLPFGTADIDVIATGLKSGGGTEVLDAPNQSLRYILKFRHTD
ncbi:hypothetical protein RS130_09800 [Paraglaciecola aquimarina]|uniref:Uncharacterized protein n=1 Tax=Paraglaciecola aquimarina TaxID=1235557 RepID=A0ABU3SVZ7_9ALTE|nr:hypothetical protein [Paraglaciecola aquimarina]MDU0354186.1 hypothetical protein [Paraglaciecola aquimarina]